MALITSAPLYGSRPELYGRRAQFDIYIYIASDARAHHEAYTRRVTGDRRRPGDGAEWPPLAWNAAESEGSASCDSTQRTAQPSDAQSAAVSTPASASPAAVA
jgi:hypothetical protein